MTTTAPPRPQHDATPLTPATQPDAARVGRRSRRRIDLSATQLVATAFAAITATVAGSYLGVTGTVIGAALASVLTAIGNAVYGSTLRSTRDRVRAVVPVRRTPDGTVVLPRVGAAGPQRVGGSRRRPHPGPRPADELPVLPAPSPRPHRNPSPADVAARTWRRVALSSIAVFVAVIAVVTGVEVVAGRPLADVLRGDSGSGTSLFGGHAAPAPATPVPTVTRTVIPKVVFTTPTVTMTAPAATATATATPSATVVTTPGASTPASSSGPASPTASTSGSGTSPAVP